jgi:hypothetical protein
MHRKGAVKLSSSMPCQSSSLVFSNRADIPAPALATRIVAGPQVRFVRSNTSSTVAGAVMSPATINVGPVQRCATAASCSPFLAVSAQPGRDGAPGTATGPGHDGHAGIRTTAARQRIGRRSAVTDTEPRDSSAGSRVVLMCGVAGSGRSAGGPDRSLRCRP